jgi:hypothetical protein
MTVTPRSPSSITACVRHRYSTGTGYAPPTATISAAFGRQSCSIEYQITLRWLGEVRQMSAIGTEEMID